MFVETSILHPYWMFEAALFLEGFLSDLAHRHGTLLEVSVSVRRKHARGQDSVQATQALPPQTGKTISLWQGCSIISASHLYRLINALKWNVSKHFCRYNTLACIKYGHVMQTVDWVVFSFCSVNVHITLTTGSIIITWVRFRGGKILSAFRWEKKMHILSVSVIGSWPLWVGQYQHVWYLQKCNASVLYGLDAYDHCHVAVCRGISHRFKAQYCLLSRNWLLTVEGRRQRQTVLLPGN